jgi:peptide/nickel transport system substrate-binding protein
MGTTNSGRHSNKEMDAKLEEALVTIDDAKREALLGEASKILMAEHGIIPIHFEISVWALRKGLTYAGRADQNTFAVDVKPVK